MDWPFRVCVLLEFIQIFSSDGAIKENSGGLALPRLLYWSLYRLLTVSILWRRYTWVTTEGEKSKSEEG